MRRSNIAEALLNSGLFKHQHPTVIEFLASHGSLTHYGRGSVIGTGSWPDFHILVKGSVQVVHYAESGREVRLCEFTDGKAFGGFDLTGDSRIAIHRSRRPMLRPFDSRAGRYSTPLAPIRMISA